MRLFARTVLLVHACLCVSVSLCVSLCVSVSVSLCLCVSLCVSPTCCWTSWFCSCSIASDLFPCCVLRRRTPSWKASRGGGARHAGRCERMNGRARGGFMCGCVCECARGRGGGVAKGEVRGGARVAQGETARRMDGAYAWIKPRSHAWIKVEVKHHWHCAVVAKGGRRGWGTRGGGGGGDGTTVATAATAAARGRVLQCT
jgi:hypothetical protein